MLSPNTNLGKFHLLITEGHLSGKGRTKLLFLSATKSSIYKTLRAEVFTETHFHFFSSRSYRVLQILSSIDPEPPAVIFLCSALVFCTYFSTKDNYISCSHSTEKSEGKTLFIRILYPNVVKRLDYKDSLHLHVLFILINIISALKVGVFFSLSVS